MQMGSVKHNDCWVVGLQPSCSSGPEVHKERQRTHGDEHQITPFQGPLWKQCGEGRLLRDQVNSVK